MKKTAVSGLLWLAILLASSMLVFPASPANSANVTENSWVSKAPMPTARAYFNTAVVNGKIYVITDSSNQEYDPATETWTTKQPMPTRRSNAAVVTYQNKIYVIGGWNDNLNPSNLNQVYNPESNTWTMGAPMLTARNSFAVAVVNDTLYAIGGTGGIANEQYTPAQYIVPSSSPATSPESTSPSSSENLQTGPLPELWVIVTAVATGTAACAGLLFYFKKRKR